MTEYKRWYDNDPILKEALELLRITPHEDQVIACDYLLELQEKVALDVIEHISDIVTEYSENGKRWYDKDPVLLKSLELLRLAPPKTQRIAALKLLLALEKQNVDEREMADDHIPSDDE